MAILELENISVSTSNWAQNMAATPSTRSKKMFNPLQFSKKNRLNYVLNYVKKLVVFLLQFNMFGVNYAGETGRCPSLMRGSTPPLPGVVGVTSVRGLPRNPTFHLNMLTYPFPSGLIKSLVFCSQEGVLFRCCVPGASSSHIYLPKFVVFVVADIPISRI